MAFPVSFSTRCKMGEYINVWVQVGDKWVNKYNILGTTFVEYAVWEPRRSGYDENGRHFSTHSTYTYHDETGECLGDMTTRDLPPELDALAAYSDERYERVHAWLEALKEEAMAIVRETFPADFY